MKQIKIVPLIVTVLLLCSCTQERNMVVPETSSYDGSVRAVQHGYESLINTRECVTSIDTMYEISLLAGLDNPISGNKAFDAKVLRRCKEEARSDPSNMALHVTVIGHQLITHEKNFDAIEAVATLMVAMQAGNEQARFLIGLILKPGSNVPSKHTMTEWLLPLIESNDSKLLAVVGSIFMDVSENVYLALPDVNYLNRYLPEEDAAWIRDKLPQMVPLKQSSGGDYYYKKVVTLFNKRIAMPFLERAYALNRDFLAGKELAIFHMRDGNKIGLGDPKKSFRLLTDTLERGSPAGHYWLSVLYSESSEQGRNVDGLVKDDAYRLKLLEAGAAHGSVAAKAELAATYLDSSREFYDPERGRNMYCLVPDARRPKRTFYNRIPIEITCSDK